MKNETATRRPKVNFDTRDTTQVQIELPTQLYKFLHDYVELQGMTLSELFTQKMQDLVQQMFDDMPGSPWFDEKAIAKKYSLTELLHSIPTPETPTSETLLNHNGGE